jgi:Na+/proline symporter
VGRVLIPAVCAPQEIINYLAPQIAGVYLLGLLWPRCTEAGAFWGLTAGFALGVVSSTGFWSW